MESVCFKFPKLAKGCFVLDLRVSGLIIGGLSAVFGFVAAVMDVVRLSSMDAKAANYRTGLSSEVTNLILDIASIFLAVYLIFGILKTRYSWLLPYLWFDAVWIALYAIAMIVTIFVNIGFGFLMFFVICLKMYFWLLVNSLYQDMYIG